MSNGRYILVRKKAVPCDDLLTWAKAFEDREARKVARTELGDGVYVSTVFLGLDHSFGQGPPLLFETMVFGGQHDQDMDRYTTWEQAEAGHRATVERIWPFYGLRDDAAISASIT